MSVRRTTALVGAAALALSLAACADEPDSSDPTDTLVIGISGSYPGIAQQDDDGTFSGFDVDLAAYVAEGLGWNARQLEFDIVAPDERETALRHGDVDMVVSAYSMTPERDTSVDFAGPYLVAGQDLLVAQDSTITGPRNLDGMTVCGLEGSPDLERLQDERYSPGVEITTQSDTSRCVGLLLDGTVDAVTHDDVVLAGYAEEHAGELRVVGTPFTTEYYGVGLPEGSPDVEAVDLLLTRAIEDGTWDAAFERYFGRSGWTPPLPPTPGVTGADVT
jgi:glutamate transport system substrate-binding protein